MKIKARKYEVELNQERIKLESLNRKLTIFETKSDQNKSEMDNMYEQLLGKDKKMSQMEIKLKDYKYRIQVLRKEKQDLENSYENKLSVLQVDQTNSIGKSQNTEEDKFEEKLNQIDQEKNLLKNQVVSL